jgi:hypothetical protein
MEYYIDWVLGNSCENIIQIQRKGSKVLRNINRTRILFSAITAKQNPHYYSNHSKGMRTAFVIMAKTFYGE